jgi:hypothetical protein
MNPILYTKFKTMGNSDVLSLNNVSIYFNSIHAVRWWVTAKNAILLSRWLIYCTMAHAFILVFKIVETETVTPFYIFNYLPVDNNLVVILVFMF